MRKAQKKQAEDFAKLLGQAHEEIRNAIGRKNFVAAMSLLADCQDGALALGNLIEKEEGGETATIPLLESYCEQVYEIYQKLEEVRGQAAAVDGREAEADLTGGSRKKHIRPDKVYKSLHSYYIRITNSLKNDIKVRSEVVFLPYKASMWDSLESVWKAADEDPDCEAYVIPIPYYDRKPDGSFGEMHYEGDQYPKYVPITRYDAYAFETRKPDKIFIHNPYDDCNYVTSVLPYFYSKNLKGFTEQLVYIPYFILNEIDPDNKAAIEGMKHFCTAPGVFNADKVIVQSEAMRQIYVNVLTELTGEDTRTYWEEKISGAGSPKVDKVWNTRKEDLELPEEWLGIIRKEDGSRKKIIFYNTGVSALLRYSEQYLVKMRDVFRVFYENREEIALLWRPHPLIRATIESMRPELWEEYQEIVEKYRTEGWGIYDDTADLDRAVCLCDGYYGDPSSVVQLCREAGKPVMVQAVIDPMNT